MSSLLVEQFTPVTFSGNEITDTVRVAAAGWAKTQQGNQVDVAAIPGGVYIDRAATNDFTRGQCDSLGAAATGIWEIALGSTGSIAVDATTQAPWSPQSVKGTGNASAVATWDALCKQGSAIAAGTSLVGSVLFSGVAGQQYRVFMISFNTDASTTTGSTTTITFGDGTRPSIVVGGKTYELLTAAAMTVAAGKTCDRYGIRVQQTTARVETVWLAHAMLEHGQAYIAPYVATSGGVTATNAVSSVQAPASILSPIQGWAATLFRAGDPGADTINSPGIFGWTDGSPNNGIYSYWHSGLANIYRAAAGASTHAAVAASWGVGDIPLVVNAWDANNVYISVNGAPFTAVANATIPSGLGATFKIGDLQYMSSPINSSVLWFGYGSGVPSSGQLAALNTRLRTGTLPRHLADTGIMF